MKKITSILDNLTNGEANEDDKTNRDDQTNQDDKTKEDEKIREGRNKVSLASYVEIRVHDKMVKDIPFIVLNYALEKSGKTFL